MRRKVSFLVELDGSLWLITNWLDLVEKPKGQRPNTLALLRLKDSDVMQDPAGVEFEDFDRLTVKLERRKKKRGLAREAQTRRPAPRGGRDASR